MFPYFPSPLQYLQKDNDNCGGNYGKITLLYLHLKLKIHTLFQSISDSICPILTSRTYNDVVISSSLQVEDAAANLLNAPTSPAGTTTTPSNPINHISSPTNLTNPTGTTTTPNNPINPTSSLTTATTTTATTTMAIATTATTTTATTTTTITATSIPPLQLNQPRPLLQERLPPNLPHRNPPLKQPPNPLRAPRHALHRTLLRNPPPTPRGSSIGIDRGAGHWPPPPQRHRRMGDRHNSHRRIDHSGGSRRGQRLL